MEISYKYLKNPGYKNQIAKTVAQIQSASSTFTIQTSGSTGQPKSIVLQKKHMLASAEATLQHLKIPNGARALLCLPADKIAGAMMLTRAMMGNWQLCVVEPSSNPLNDLENESFHFSAMVPLQVKKSLVQLNQIDKLIIGGGAVNDKLISALQTKRTASWNTFGMTETISHVAMRKLAPQLKNVFSALPGVQFAQDENNRLIITAPRIGVKNMLTNDVVKLIDQKNFQWLGRFDNVVNSAGIKLYPEEIEKKLELHQNCFLAGLPDADLGEKLILIIESDQALSPAELERALIHLGKYEKPKEVFYLSKFVYTTNGKIKRSATLHEIKS